MQLVIFALNPPDFLPGYGLQEVAPTERFADGLLAGVLTGVLPAAAAGLLHGPLAPVLHHAGPVHALLLLQAGQDLLPAQRPSTPAVQRS